MLVKDKKIWYDITNNNIFLGCEILLQFVFGRPASGKTFTILQMLKKLTDEGKQSVLLVPEQFTFESERAVLKTIGDRSTLFVNVVSFSRLYDEIGRKIGGIAGTVLRDSDKIIFMSRTLKMVSSELKLWGRYVNSVDFAKTLLDTIGEFKINAITSEDLKKASLTVSSPTLKNKLRDISLIYENYDSLVGEKFLDPADTLANIYESLKGYEFFKGKTVFLDSFKGFTGQQYKIIERIFSQADDVIISLTDDKTITGKYCVFANIRKAIKKIEEIAKSRAVKIKEPIFLQDNHYNSKALTAVERMLVGCDFDKEFNKNDITLFKGHTIYDEAEFAARMIRKLVRTQNYRFKDFVIIVRDSEKYQFAVETACKNNKINCFSDSKIPLSAFPLAVAGKNAIKALDFSTEAILNFHKTGLGTLNTEEISLLENYTFVWGIKGKTWLSDWTMDPRGFTNSNDDDGTVAKELENLNRIRKLAIKPLYNFKEGFCDNARNMSKALVELFDFCDCAKKLNKICNDYKGFNNNFYTDAIKQSYDEYMNILDSLVLCFGDISISKKEFFDALDLSVSLTKVGVIPQTLDEVTFGSADRIRPSLPKVAFILGANQDEFPKTISNNGVFSLRERKDLINNEILIPDNAIETSIEENYLVYSNLCCPTNKLFISYCEKTLSGELKEPSSFFNEIKDELDCKVIDFPANMSFSDFLPETSKSAFGDYCRLLREYPDVALGIKKALDETEYSYATYSLHSSDVKKNASLTPDTAQKLFGSNIYMSATKFDNYNKCKFSYFCKYGLGVKKLEAADFNVLQRGTIVHYVLERLISIYKENIGDLDYDTLDSLTDKYIEEYLDCVAGFNDIRDYRSEFLIGRISRSLKDVVHHVADEISQSKFKPVACELKIGFDGDINVKFPYDKGNIILNGSIDRVDEYNGYIRIIDYKTGSKSFKLPDILVGLNMQMLLYLYSVIRGNGKSDNKAAGILYQPSKRDLGDNGMAMNGLVTSNTDIVFAMEETGMGEYIPKVNLTKNNTISKTSTSFISSESFKEIFDYIERLMRETGNKISSGEISVSPIDGMESAACKYCDYAGICGNEDSKIPKVERLKNDDVINKLKGAE